MPTSTAIEYNTSTVTYNDSRYSYDGYDAQPSNMPSIGVFIAWTDGPYVASPAWTDITNYVRSIDVKRGRANDLDNVAPGTASLVLDNRTRLFDPFNTSGANYANLKPRRQIKIISSYAGVEYPVFRGFISGWPVSSNQGGNDSTVTIDCFDVMSLLATEFQPFDWADQYILSLSPTHYWRFDETIDPTFLPSTATGTTSFTFADSGTSPAPMYSTSQNRPLSNVDPLARGISSKAISFSNGTYPSTGASPNLPGSPTFTITGWHTFVNQTGGTIYSWCAYSFPVSGQYTQIEIFYDISNSRFGISLSPQANGSTVRQYFYTVGIDFREGHHMAVSMTVTSPNTATISNFMMDGVQLAQTSTTTYVWPYGGASGPGIYFWDGANQQCVLVEGTAWSESQLRTLYQLGNNVLIESTSSRASRVLANTSVPTTKVITPASPVATVAQIGQSGGVLPELQIAAESENAPLFADREGNIVLLDRGYFGTRSRSATSRATITDTGTGLYYDADNLDYMLDADLIRNDVTIQYTGDSSVRSKNTTSISTFGNASESLDTALSTPAQATSLASWRLSLYNTPKIGVAPFVIKPQRDPANALPKILDMELFDRVTFKRTPSVGSAIQRDMLIQGIEHRITPGTWDTTLTVSSRATGWVIVGISTIGSTEETLF